MLRFLETLVCAPRGLQKQARTHATSPSVAVACTRLGLWRRERLATSQTARARTAGRDRHVQVGCGQVVLLGGWGWLKLTMQVCKSSDACSVSIQNYLNSSTALANSALNTSMMCSSVPTVYAASHMSCAVNVPLLQTLFPGTSTLTISRFLNASRTPGGTTALQQAGIAGGDNVIWAQLWYEDVEQFYCTASSCVQTVSSTGSGTTNSSDWNCPTLNCTCRPGTSFCGGGASVSCTQAMAAPTDMYRPRKTSPSPLTLSRARSPSRATLTERVISSRRS